MVLDFGEATDGARKGSTSVIAWLKSIPSQYILLDRHINNSVQDKPVFPQPVLGAYSTRPSNFHPIITFSTPKCTKVLCLTRPNRTELMFSLFVLSVFPFM